jgi:hypothetical protein
MRDLVPNLMEVDHVIKPSNSPHLVFPIRVLVVLLVDELDVFPDYPLLVFVELKVLLGELFDVWLGSKSFFHSIAWLCTCLLNLNFSFRLVCPVSKNKIRFCFTYIFIVCFLFKNLI